MIIQKIKLAALSLAAIALALAPVASVNAASPGTVAYGGGGTVHVRNADGTNDKVVYNYDLNSFGLSRVRLSQDGSRAVINLFAGSNGRVVVVDTVTNAVLRDINPGAFVFGQDISPDGSKILIVDGAGTKEVNVASGAETLLTVPAGLSFSEYTPDGLSIIGSQTNVGPGTTDVVSYLISTQAVTVLKAGVAATADASNRAGFVSYDGTINYLASAGACGNPQQSRIISVTGTGDAAFSTPTTDAAAVFAPDGASVLFYRSATPLVVTCAGGGGEVLRDIQMANRDGSGAVLAFSAAGYDWAGGSVAAAAAAPSLSNTGSNSYLTTLILGISLMAVAGSVAVRRMTR